MTAAPIKPRTHPTNANPPIPTAQATRAMADGPQPEPEHAGAPPPTPPTNGDHAVVQVSALSDNDYHDDDDDDETLPPPPPPPSAATSASVVDPQTDGEQPTLRQRRRWAGKPPSPAASPQPPAAALKLPPGVAPVADFTSIFCAVSAVALTLLATTLPYEGTTREEERQIHRGLMYYFLRCVGLCVLWGHGRLDQSTYRSRLLTNSTTANTNTAPSPCTSSSSRCNQVWNILCSSSPSTSSCSGCGSSRSCSSQVRDGHAVNRTLYIE